MSTPAEARRPDFAANPLPRAFLRWFIMLPALVLVGAVAVQAFNPFGEIAQPRPAHLAQTVPFAVSGDWTVRDRPLGPNEFVAEAAQRILRTDDFVHREYRRGRIVVGVYAAYWGAGKMPVRLVSSHTPDRCWTENGWKCRDMRFKELTQAVGQTLQPAEWRRFEDPSGATTHVRFWHLIEGRVFDFGERFNLVPDPVSWWKDAVQQAIQGSPEQYFIRITSNVPFEEVWNDSGIQEVLGSFATLGLAAAPVQSP